MSDFFIGTPQSEPVGEKKRHGCLTVYLVLILIVNSLLTYTYLVTPPPDTGPPFHMPLFPTWVYGVMAITGLLNLISAVAILRWKKWGFWLFANTSFITVWLNYTMGMSFATSIVGLVGVAILYGVLHIGGDKKGWTQLE